jgi:lipopolysaccharide export LptBFGC system permease protein LptF
MLFTLHKYILRELLKVFILATVALTLIMSIGSILQPIQQYGAGPRQVIFILIYFLPITLTFILPLSALFAGALVYGRFASDNELDACRASGISILTLVRPGLYLAVFVAAANLFLSFQIMPRFVHLAESSLKADAKQMLFRNIQKKGFYEIPSEKQIRYLIYADQVNPQNDTLTGVIVTRVKNNQIEQITTAQSAIVTFTLGEKENEVRIITKKAFQMDSGGVLEIDSLPVIKRFGSLLSDDITFKRIDQMTQIQKDMTLFEPIAQNAEETFVQFVTELLAERINKTFSGKPAVSGALNNDSGTGETFFELPGEPNGVRFSVAQCSIKDKQIELSGPITVIEYDATGKNPPHTFSTTQAYLSIEAGKNGPMVAMDIRNARQEDTNRLMMRHFIAGLRMPDEIRTISDSLFVGTGSLNTDKLTSDFNVLAGLKPSSILKGLQSGLRKEIQKTTLQIRAEIHSRLVFGIGCVAMILIGIGLGVFRRDGHLLSAFGASCIPAAMLIVCIMSGKQLTKNLAAQTISGVTIMWAGLGLLFLLAFVIYYRLMKN